MSAAVTLINTVIAFVFIIIVIVYNHFVIKPNANRAHWKCRRATSGWFFFYLLTVTTNDFVRCFICLLRSYEVLTNDQAFSLLLKPTTYYGSLTFASIRVWFLWFDLRKNRESQRFLLSQQLNSSLYEVNVAKPVPSRNNNKLGGSKRATIVVFLAATFFFVVSFSMDLIGMPALAAVVSPFYVLLSISFYTYFLFSFCCCCCGRSSLQSSFRDDCAVLLELKLFYAWWWIGAISGFALLLPVNIFDDRYPVYLSCTVVVSRIVVLALILYVPYRTGRRFEIYRATNKVEKRRAKTDLQKILCRRSYFFAFVEHLVQEMSIENLTFLVEVWQFKNEQRYALTADKAKAADVVDDENRPAAVLYLGIPTWEDSTSSPATEIADASLSALPGSPRQPSADQSATLSTAQQRHLVTMLMGFRWAELPVARSIARHAEDKWAQCRVLFEKYIQEQSMDCINIGFHASDAIHRNFMLCKEYAQTKHGNQCGSLEWQIPGAAASDDQGDELVVQEEIKDDSAFQQAVMNLFDVALNDVFDNMNDAFQRFLRSQEFEALQ